MDHINVIRMRFALIQKKVMVAFVKMDSMVMDSLAVFYVLKEPNLQEEHVLISTNVLKIQQFASIKTKFAKIPLVHILVSPQPLYLQAVQQQVNFYNINNLLRNFICHLLRAKEFSLKLWIMTHNLWDIISFYKFKLKKLVFKKYPAKLSLLSSNYK